MPTTQQLPHPPLEATGFFQPQPSSGVEVTGVEPPPAPEGAVSAAAGLAPLEEKEAEQERGKGRTKRKDSPSAESG